MQVQFEIRVSDITCDKIILSFQQKTTTKIHCVKDKILHIYEATLF